MATLRGAEERGLQPFSRPDRLAREPPHPLASPWLLSPLPSPLSSDARKKKRGANTRTGGPETPLNSASLEVGESQRKAEEPRDLFAFLRLCCCLPLLLTAHHTTHAAHAPALSTLYSR